MNPDINVNELIHTCVQKVIDGMSVHKVKTMLKKEYGCSENEVLNIIGEVKKNIKSISEDDTDIVLDVNIEKLLNMYEIALKANNLKVAKDCIDLINKMQGAYTQKVDLNANVNEYHFRFGE